MYNQQMDLMLQTLQPDQKLDYNPRMLFTADRLFRLALRKSTLQRYFDRLTGRRSTLLNLSESVDLDAVQSRRYRGTLTVPLKRIRGSESRSQDFDARFRPLNSHNRERWMGIAVLMMKDESLPPVDLIQLGENYYVRDGHHRVSAARALGQIDIDATVTVWQTAGPTPQPAAQTPTATLMRA